MSPSRKPRPSRATHTLAVDVGGSHIKASLVDSAGHPLGERTRIRTPHPFDAGTLLEAVADLVERHERCDRITVGVNGLVHDGFVYSVPLTGDESFKRFPLESELVARTSKPVRVMNDAEMHGLGAIQGTGVELVITLGTGLGTALFIDGQRGPHIHFVPSPAGDEELRGGDYGDEAVAALGRKKWRKRVKALIVALRRITNFDHLFVGGGNAELLRDEDLDDDVTLVDNSIALVGGARAWTWDVKS